MNKGFSLIELLIVVSIILVIAAIAIPSLIRSRIAANEASAAAALRTINVAEATFASTYNSGFTEDLRRLGAPPGGGPGKITGADLVDPVIAGNAPGNTGANGFIRNGYTFVYSPTGGGTTFGSVFHYQVNADPQQRGSTGRRSFFSDDTAVVRGNVDAAATASDNPI